MNKKISDSSPSHSLSRRHFVALGVAGLGSTILGSKRGEAQNATAQNAAAQNAAAQKVTSLMPNSILQNRAPLKEVPFIALPLGSIEARGWLLHQLELQRDGLTGHADEILPAAKNDSAWLGGTGEDWEKGPYYVKGLVPLAYTLGDEKLKAKAQKWIDAILNSQREDGFFGPKTNDDWWPRMVATYLLRDYAEATNDARVAPFLTKYYRHMLTNLPKRALRDWGRARAGDEMDTVFWLYNRSGDNFLLDLADLLYQQAYPWRDIFSENRFMEYGTDYQPKHNVNVPQAMKLPPIYWQRSQNYEDRDAWHLGEAHLNANHGTALQMNSGTESLSGRSSTQGIETCSFVERMLSDETALRILGDASIGDNLEAIAFNGLAAALSKDFHQHVYYTLPNNVTARRGGLGFTQDYADGRSPAPRSGYPCCCYNLHMGWPKLAQSCWAATKEGGLAALAYLPSQVTASVGNLGGDSTKVTIISDTNYPFEEEIRLTINVPREVTFPLKLRIPSWCENATISINGDVQKAPRGQFAMLSRLWKNGDKITLRFPMTVRTAEGVNNSRSVWHGPLLYSLKIEEKWQPFTEEKREGAPDFESYEVLPQSPWNYALADLENIEVQRRAMPQNPFDPAKTPVALQASARKIVNWTMAYNQPRALEPPVSPVASAAPLETISLVPFGAQMLRISNFPFIGTPPPIGEAFQDNFPDSHFDNWITYGGGWLVDENGFGPSPDATSGFAVATLTRFRDFSYDAHVTLGEAGDAGLIFRVKNPAIGSDNYQGYYCGLNAAQNRVELGKADGKWTPIKAAPQTLSPKRAYHVRILANGPQIRVFIDNMAQPVLEASDETYSEGAIGVRQYGGVAEKAQARFAHILVGS